MNKLIPLALVIGMAGSQVQAEENQIQEIQGGDKIGAIIATTGKNMNASLGAENELRTQWNNNVEKFAKTLLPGDPLSYHANGIQGIVYKISQLNNNGTIMYAGRYTACGEMKFGILVHIPIGGK